MTDENDRGKSTQFKPGHSGNAKGRPRKNKPGQTGSAFDVLANLRIQVQMHGVGRELTVAEALLYRTFQDALAGDRMATRTVLKKISAREAARSPGRRPLPSFHFAFRDPANVDEALLLLRIATQPEGLTRDNGRPHLELEPLAVIAALAGSKRRRLTEKDLREVKSQTRDSESIGWPSGDDD